MKKLLVMALLLSITVYFLTQDGLIIEHNQLSYYIPILYPCLALLWLFLGGVAIGMQWSSWEKYRLRHHMRYYQTCAKEAEKRLDEARWIVCEIVSGRPLLRLVEIAADYKAGLGDQGDILSNCRKGGEGEVFSENRLIDRAIKEEKWIDRAIASQSSIDSLHYLQKLPWDCWTNIAIAEYILKSWEHLSDPVRIWLISKISPVYWSNQAQKALFNTIRKDPSPERWVALLKKQHWFESNIRAQRVIEDIALLGH